METILSVCTRAQWLLEIMQTIEWTVSKLWNFQLLRKIILSGLRWLLNNPKLNFNLRMDSQIPFFCGDSLDCRTLGSKHALETAMRNIQEKVKLFCEIHQVRYSKTFNFKLLGRKIFRSFKWNINRIHLLWVRSSNSLVNKFQNRNIFFQIQF